MIKNTLVAITLLASIGNAFASQQVTILGFPLGGKYDSPSKMCTLSQITTSYPKTFCWVGKSIEKGVKSGRIQIPNDKSLPNWAVDSSFDIKVGKDGVLDRVSVNSLNVMSDGDILKSISGRFGSPKLSHIIFDNKIATWEAIDLDITMICSNRECTVNFISDRERAFLAKEHAAKKAANDARPASP